MNAYRLCHPLEFSQGTLRIGENTTLDRMKDCLKSTGMFTQTQKEKYYE